MFVEPGGAIAVVDFGIMGRLDRKTRYYLADMLLAFLTGDYDRVAGVHFEAGYVPPGRSVDEFAQACRSIGEPILGRPLADISVARLLAQLFLVTEPYEMETQPQLLLLQKTMVLIEGLGRQLDPTVNMWELARPLIEAWMLDNRGPGKRGCASISTIWSRHSTRFRTCCVRGASWWTPGPSKGWCCTPRASPPMLSAAGARCFG